MPLYFLFDHTFGARAEICHLFVIILENLIHQIIWPLTKDKSPLSQYLLTGLFSRNWDRFNDLLNDYYSPHSHIGVMMPTQKQVFVKKGGGRA